MKKYMLGLMMAGLGGLAALPAAELAPAQDTYPLTTCVVSGEKLGEMAPPVIYHHEGREVRFCCKECVGKFKANPAKYLKMIDDARARVGTKN